MTIQVILLKIIDPKELFGKLNFLDYYQIIILSGLIVIFVLFIKKILKENLR